MLNPQMLASLLGGGQGKANGNPVLSVGQISPQYLAAALQEQQTQEALQGVNASGPQSKNALALALNLGAKAVLDRKAVRLGTQLGAAQLAQNQALAQQLRPGNKTFATLMARDPQGALAEVEKAEIAPTDVRQGNTLVNAPNSVAGSQGSAPGTFTAPTTVDDGGQMGYQTPAGFHSIGARPMNYAEGVAQAGQTETARHNLISEQQGQQGLGIQQQGLGIQAQQAQASLAQAAAAQQNAGTSAASLATQQQTTPTFALPPGYVIGAPKR